MNERIFANKNKTSEQTNSTVEDIMAELRKELLDSALVVSRLARARFESSKKPTPTKNTNNQEQYA